MILYTLKLSTPGYSITKFDDDLNPVATYWLSALKCECPAGPRPTCRHRQMLPAMKARANSPWFYHFESGTWHDPLGQNAPIEGEILGPSQTIRVKLPKDYIIRDEHKLQITSTEPAEPAPLRRRI